jgi:hypothetical protein
MLSRFFPANETYYVFVIGMVSFLAYLPKATAQQMRATPRNKLLRHHWLDLPHSVKG